MYRNHEDKIEKIKSGELSLIDNVTDFLSSISRKKELNAYNFVFEEEALSQAEKIKNKIDSGRHGRLAGMVIAVKDLLAYKDHPLTCSSRMLQNFSSVYTATAIQTLLDEDAIIIGKTNCDEFAMGSSNESSFFGSVLNPHNKEYVPGGSSGGSAAAVAANLCDLAIGTDTGGSIRQPASFCGVYGLKPTYGLVSRYGLTAYASSFDCIGPIAKNIDDINAVIDIISGHDEKDSTSCRTVPQNENEFDINSVRIGIPAEFYGEGLDPQILSVIQNEITKLREAGLTVKEVSLPNTEYTISAYYILATAEASSNLARYDGVRFGYRSASSRDLAEMYINSRTEGFGKEVKRRIMLGTYVLSAGYYDAYYRKAQKVRRMIKNDFNRIFSEVDILITPTTPTTAFKIGEKLSDPLQMYLSDIYTVSANLAGIPGLNVPIGKTATGMPFGMQLLSDSFKEKKILSLAKKFYQSLC